MKLPADSRKLTVCFTVLLLLPLQIAAQRDFARYVDPFIGTAGHGHTFPGATMPFGMVQLSPDTRLTGWDGCSGYHYSDNIIYGFSHTHLSGTGISDYGDILLMPTVGEAYVNALGGAGGDQTEQGYASRFSHQNENARPGYYAVKLDDDNISVELTATRRTGLHRYLYPQTDRANIILDLSHRDKVLDSYLRIVDSTHVEGFRRSEAWAKDQIVYFVAEFSQPFLSSNVFIDGVSAGLSEARGTNVKAALRFSTRAGQPVLTKVAISAVSLEGARKNLAAELNHWDFEKTRSDAVRAWNAELNKIEVNAGTDAQLKNFYTALYHTMIAPNLFMDADGQYRGRDFKIHQAQGFENYTVFSLWDTFRAAHPLYTIIDQKRTVDFIRTFLAQYEQGGRLPVWELAANETETMIGYHAVSVIADAAIKGISLKGVDSEQAFAAMKQSAELRHFGLGPYLDHGYINLEEERESVSRTLEYAYDDWCIAQMARLLGHTADYNRYLERAQFYKNVFDTQTGFMRPRTNGGWLTPFDPREVNFSFTEANSWQYTFFVPHDVSGLVELMGGKQKFAAKLDQLFTADSQTTGRDQADITGLIGQYAHGNEPSHHMAYLYNYVNQPWKTQARVRQILDDFYQPEPDGLIGNEDCGQMSAWYVLSAAGFYPVTPGSPVYAIGSPLFPEVRFNLENGKTFVVKAGGVSARNIYVQSARLNGRAYRKSYLNHSDLMAGGELVLEMAAQPNQNWGVGPNDVPVSRIDGKQIVPVPVIGAAGKTFKDRMTITIQDNSAQGSSVQGSSPTVKEGSSFGRPTIHYTTDGSQPGPGSPVYTKPFLIDHSITIKAVAVSSDGRRSLVATASYHRIPHNWIIGLNSKYSSQYTGGGDFALIDGIRGTANWSGGGWQGYQGQDLIAVVDLGKVESVSKLGAGFLQDAGSWIWMPRSVDFEVSLDGRNFTQVVTISNEVPDGSKPGEGTGAIMKDFVKGFPPRNARYVRIRAHNFGKIPAWHPGHGGDAWIFADELIIE
ncbi:MAG TPA: GH92 family glycosyl hydrolase [Pyrinomonadaceae bacterium]|nr:GH92 family glycosyl hydrolase [Pyrinomonadaceae bacterium]